MRDVDDVENTERNRHAACHRRIKAADQNAGYDGVDEKIERKDHYFVLRKPAGTLPSVATPLLFSLCARSESPRLMVRWLFWLTLPQASRTFHAPLSRGMTARKRSPDTRPQRGPDPE